jgi:hypothetical protein
MTWISNRSGDLLDLKLGSIELALKLGSIELVLGEERRGA